MSFLNVQIIAPDRKVFESGRITRVVIPATWGQMEILPDYAEYMTTLDDGKVTIFNETSEESFEITGGLISVSHNEVNVIVDGTRASVTPLEGK